MKKSQLIKIIRESLKELKGKKLINKKSITEQNPNQEACQSAGTTYNQQASGQVGQAYNAGFPFSGRPGISTQFIATMAGKPTQFYQARKSAFIAKKLSLRNTGAGFCNGDNPMWQAKLTIKSLYAQHCRDNPGTC